MFAEGLRLLRNLDDSLQDFARVPSSRGGSFAALRRGPSAPASLQPLPGPTPVPHCFHQLYERKSTHGEKTRVQTLMNEGSSSANTLFDLTLPSSPAKTSKGIAVLKVSFTFYFA